MIRSFGIIARNPSRRILESGSVCARPIPPRPRYMSKNHQVLGMNRQTRPHSLFPFLLVCTAFLAVLTGGSKVFADDPSDALATSRSIAWLPDRDGRQLSVLRGSWYLWDPYQFSDTDASGLTTVRGLDVELTRTIARTAGFAIDYSYRPWDQHLFELRRGEVDLATGATWTAERSEYAYFSKPYRREVNSLFLPKGMAEHYGFTDVPGMLAMFSDSGFRLGAIKGFAFADPAVNDYIADPANAERVVFADSNYENFRHLMDGTIDGFLADRLAASTSAWRLGWRDQVEEHPLRFSTDIRFMFSKASVTPETVAQFDQAIEDLKFSGTLRRIFTQYMFPILLAQTLDTRWFFFADVIGTIAFALSGVLIAHRERYSLVGALVLAALPALGGGIIRDLIVGREQLAVIASPLPIALVGVTVVTGYLLFRIGHSLHVRGVLPAKVDALVAHPWVRNLYEFSDAVGIAAFTVTGVAVAVASRVEPLWIWGPLLAMLTAAGGGILRDLVRQSGTIASLKTEFYAEVPMFWGLFLSLYLFWGTSSLEPEHLVVAVTLTMVGAFLTRMTAVFFRLRSPSFS